MRLLHLKHIAMLGAAASLLALLGCSSLPTEPTPAATSGAQAGIADLQIIRVPVPIVDESAPGAGDAGATGEVDRTGDLSTGSAAAATQPTSVSGSGVIDGSRGGRVSAGRFAVIVPPLAIRGTATITIVVPDTSRLLCDISISPPSANKFLLPVTLRTDCSGIPGLHLDQLVTFWYNPALNLWIPQLTVPDLLSQWVSTPLWHFSRYAVSESNPGKSGW